MTLLFRLLCTLTLLLMTGTGFAHASTPAGAIAVGYGGSFADLHAMSSPRSVAAQTDAWQPSVSTIHPSESGPSVPPVVDLLDFSGFEPYVRSLLPVRLPDIAEFGPLVPDPAPLAVFGIVLIAIGFLRRYLSA